MELKGSCLCGAVAFVITGSPGGMGQCHCSRCRKLGSSTMIFVSRAQFRLTRGAEELATLEPRAPYTYRRSFCRCCGTALGEPLSRDETFPINAHCLDGDPGVRVSFHEYLAERPP
ncbi:GFA family protein [Dinoroseobacter sp. S124A]|uniref:GFA family protein n=1 Tax=Dinoroseobacter sp. S124A TaxID=3415128 RepID=UPI003C7D7F3F